ncbi:MAG: SDR family oxidoreductase [Lachnospiraceae bacterium]|nr:SDR family oxidoreductase [Lachnospiraceae bacterium]
MTRDLQGKNAIITGGRKGIGRKIVECLAERGADMWVCSHEKSVEFERDMKELAQKHQVRIETVYFDLCNETEISNQMKYILQQKRSIDILINNAGMAYGGMLAMQSMQMLKETFAVNFFGPMQMIQIVSKAMMRQKSGNIVNIASVSGCENYGGNISYGSSKAALIWATKEMSKELAPFGIRVNAVSPGMTNTDMGNSRTEKQQTAMLERIAMKRIAEPEEVAKAVMFLISDEASYINGHNLVVDGGRLNH